MFLTFFSFKNVYAVTGYLDNSDNFTFHPNGINGSSSAFKLVDNDVNTGLSDYRSCTFYLKKPVTIVQLFIANKSSNYVIITFKDSNGVVLKQYTRSRGATSTPEYFDFYCENVSEIVTYSGDTIYEFSEFDIVVDNELKVTSTIPSNKSNNVSPNTDILVNLNKKIISVGSVSINDVATPVEISGNVIKLKKSSLDYNTTYVVSLKNILGVEDLKLDYSFSFTTMGDNLPVEVVNVKPPPNSVDIPLNTEIKIEFNKKNIDSNSLDKVFIKDVKSTKKLNGNILSLSLIEPLEKETTYTIHIEGVKDLSGNKLVNPVEVKFTTTKNGVFYLMSYKPLGSLLPTSSRFEFYFNNNVNSESVKYSFKKNGVEDVVCSKNIIGSSVVFIPQNLENDTNYTFTFLECTDLDGNLFSSPVTLDFKTLKSTGNGMIDDIFDSVYDFINIIGGKGLFIVLGAIALGLIFVGGKWLWNKLKIWLKKS